MPNRKNKPVKLPVSHFKKISLLLGGFFIYLLAAPQINTLLTACLQLSPGQSYQYKDCHIALILDRFVAIGLIGLTANILGFVFVFRPSPAKTAVFGLLLALSTIAAYYLYIPQAEAALKHIPVILDPDSF